MTQPDREGSWRPYPSQPDPDSPDDQQQPQQQLPPPPAVHPPNVVARAQVRPPQAPLPPPPQFPPAQAQFPPAQAPFPPAQAQFPPVNGPFPPGQGQLAPPPGQAMAPVQPAQAVQPVQAPAVQLQQEQQGTTDATGRRLAAPQLTSAPLAGPQGRALAAAQAAHGWEDDFPPDEPGDEDDEARTGPSGKVSPLHIGWHAISRKTLRRVTVAPSAGAGLVLGRDRQHAPVPLHLFAPEPVRIALVGGVWAAQLLIFRAFALGARVVVVTTEPRAWAGFGERATGQYNRLTVHSSDQGEAPSGSAQMPTLVVYDLGMTGPATTPPLGPWRTQLTILRQLDRPGLAALQDVQLTLLQRLGGDEAALAASALKLRPHSSQFLQFMADDMLALIGEGTDRYLFLAQTQTEQQFVGLPRR
ncbi:hypothetical protein [Actinoplanes regularis]|uniref:Uncharacterized protein n=1 Tax=Actinoplanes regularis TaxID=52697 RepID=A0A238WLC4_9ACTN|nr:hypothetical protein [Actinoplanes regularis]GIE84758.1 hypothetical protein Are01nite_12380 [Actinoplanes regularis]SNR47365.1 hypothetical protein SAMN06264365_102666 [Actinoplanes regularis]